jgi:Fic family protein
MAYDKHIPYNDLPDLHLNTGELESPAILKSLTNATRNLAKLDGLCASLPDPALIINTIVLQESKESSAIENIVTTQGELYIAATEESTQSQAAKEVLNYRQALYSGLKKMQEQQNIITSNTLIEIVKVVKQNNAGIRNTPGTVLKNSITGEVIYTPPCCEDVIRKKLSALEKFINEENSHLDPILKMAMIHYQFESIHPFNDGNGRTGRILNALYLVQQQLLSMPVLYLSSYIVKYKSDYYRLLKEVTEQNNWKDWCMFILTAVAETAKLTTENIQKILLLKETKKAELKKLFGTSYNSDLLDLMFTLPYLKIELLERKGIAQRQTASVYLKKLADAKVLTPQKVGRTTYYVNHELMSLLSHSG